MPTVTLSEWAMKAGKGTAQKAELEAKERRVWMDKLIKTRDALLDAYVADTEGAGPAGKRLAITEGVLRKLAEVALEAAVQKTWGGLAQDERAFVVTKVMEKLHEGREKGGGVKGREAVWNDIYKAAGSVGGNIAQALGKPLDETKIPSVRRGA